MISLILLVCWCKVGTKRVFSWGLPMSIIVAVPLVITSLSVYNAYPYVPSLKFMVKSCWCKIHTCWCAQNLLTLVVCLLVSSKMAQRHRKSSSTPPWQWNKCVRHFSRSTTLTPLEKSNSNFWSRSLKNFTGLGLWFFLLFCPPPYFES